LLHQALERRHVYCNSCIHPRRRALALDTKTHAGSPPNADNKDSHKMKELGAGSAGLGDNEDTKPLFRTFASKFTVATEYGLVQRMVRCHCGLF